MSRMLYHYSNAPAHHCLDADDFTCRENDEKPSRSACQLSKKCFRKNNDNCFYNLVRPYLYYMQLCGLYFEDNSLIIGTEGKIFQNTGKIGHSSLKFWKTYSFIMIIINWVYFLTFFVPTLIMIPRLNFGSFAMMSCMVVWTLQNSINASTMYYLSSKWRLYREILRKWDILYRWKNYHSPLPHLAAYRNVGLVFCLMTNCLNQTGKD